MKHTKESSSFGRYLQSIRHEKKISLEKVSQETRIAVRNLKLIEKEDLEALPDEVFVKGFLRAFARAIGADGDEAVRLYRARLNMEIKLASAGNFSPKSSLTPWRNLILSITALLALIIVSLYGVSYFQHQTSAHQGGEAPSESNSLQETLPRDQKVTSAKNESTPKAFQKLVLQISAMEDTWIKVIVDNLDPKEYNLLSGEVIEVEASTGYNLLIGNAGGLELKLNGEPIKIHGKNGEVVNIELP